VIKSNEGCSLRIHVVGKDGIRPKFPKAIKVQLPGKTRKVAMLEILGQNITGELFHILNDEIVSRRRPSCDVLIALIDHVVSFCTKDTEKMENNKIQKIRGRGTCTADQQHFEDTTCLQHDIQACDCILYSNI